MRELMVAIDAAPIVLFFAFLALILAMVELAMNHERTSLFFMLICSVLLLVALLIPNP